MSLNTEHFKQEMAELERQQQEFLATFLPPCPSDGLAGTYIGDVGSAQLVVRVFTCPNGDRFSFRQDLQKGRLISPNQWRFIRLRTRDSLAPTDLAAQHPQPAQGATPSSGDAK